MANSETAFGGAKLALFVGRRLLVIQRDDRPDIPWPGYWDFPGGGREGDESPQTCVLRETAEETGLILHAGQLAWGRAFPGPLGVDWFFVAHLPGGDASRVRLGDEGQGYNFMAPADYVAHPRAIPHFAERLTLYLTMSGG